MRKYDFISALAKETAAEVVKNREEWMKYLTTAARLYKYPFREQLLIYAQRPDATACASIELWNERMHCWVNKGAKGIALLDEDDAHGKRLKYVFDVSDVHAARRIGRYPELWELHEEHKEDVIKRLEQTYGATDDKKLFEERLMELADRIAADYYEELLPDLQYMIEGSFLEGLYLRVFLLHFYLPAVQICRSMVRSLLSILSMNLIPWTPLRYLEMQPMSLQNRYF